MFPEEAGCGGFIVPPTDSRPDGSSPPPSLHPALIPPRTMPLGEAPRSSTIGDHASDRSPVSGDQHVDAVEDRLRNVAEEAAERTGSAHRREQLGDARAVPRECAVRASEPPRLRLFILGQRREHRPGVCVLER